MTHTALFVIQIPGWMLLAYLVVAQCSAALSYQFGVRMGTQEPADRITEVGVAFWKGLAGADLVFYTPLLAFGLIGQIFDAEWAELVLAAALGITVYWPIVCLWTVRAARGAQGWSLPKEYQYWAVLPAIGLWGLCALSVLWSSVT